MCTIGDDGNGLDGQLKWWDRAEMEGIAKVDKPGGREQRRGLAKAGQAPCQISSWLLMAAVTLVLN